MLMQTLKTRDKELENVLKRSTIDYQKSAQAVSEIISDVRQKGDEALIRYNLKFDKQQTPTLQITEKQIDDAVKRLDKQTLASIKASHKNIKKYHLVQSKNIKRAWQTKIAEGVIAGEKILPIPSVGCYVPGGRASYPSTVLMSVTVAKIAGVKRVVVASPPKISDTVLAACKISGADEVYQVGGAQAIAALAYGTQSIKSVSKIVGPGNKYVTCAKSMVYGAVDIDMPAGPSEILIIADESSNPKYIAADILAQAEHDPNAQCVLTTHSQKTIDAVKSIVQDEVAKSEKKDILLQSLNNITLIKTNSLKDSIDFANEYAPEHLEIHAKNQDKIAKKITNAGAVFIGEYSPVAAGDYASGANHVLPTGGAAKYASQLSVRDFLKSMSTQKITLKGLANLSKTITTLAKAEGLPEHAKSITKRLK